MQRFKALIEEERMAEQDLEIAQRRLDKIRSEKRGMETFLLKEG